MTEKMYRKRTPGVRIYPFEPDMACKTLPGEKKPIYYIRTREGLRLIDESMYVADKGNGYTHPMAPNVFENNYVQVDDSICSDIRQEINKLEDIIDAGFVEDVDDFHKCLDTLHTKLGILEKLIGVANGS